jgi:hypothetical protein
LDKRQHKDQAINITSCVEDHIIHATRPRHQEEEAWMNGREEIDLNIPRFKIVGYVKKGHHFSEAIRLLHSYSK